MKNPLLNLCRKCYYKEGNDSYRIQEQLVTCGALDTFCWYRHISATVRLIYVNSLMYPADTPIRLKTFKNILGVKVTCINITYLGKLFKSGFYYDPSKIIEPSDRCSTN